MSSSDAELVAVASVRVLRGHVVELTFDNDARRVLDLAPYLWGPAFEPIVDDYEAFCALRVEGGTVAWPNGADLSPDLLYAGSTPSAEAR